MKSGREVNLGGQTLLFRCLDTEVVTTAPALTRQQSKRCQKAQKAA